MLKLTKRLSVCLLLACAPAMAATYHIDPAKGTADGDGSQAKPWKTLEEAAGKLGALKGGDTVLLHTGHHGDVSITGENDAPVTIAAAEKAKPTLSKLTISAAKNWVIKGLAISPSFGEPYTGNIVTVGEKGDTSDVVIEGCYIFTAESSAEWDAQKWMAANNGMLLGRNGRNLTARNNYISNVRMGISMTSFDSVAEGNVITDYSGDAIRMTRDNLVAQYNIIKNIYVSEEDGDKNHDDGIQCFLFNAGKGTLKNQKMIGNIIIAHEDPNQKLKNTLQGIGLFDGPLIDFVVTDNVVNVDSWHGISLYDAQNSKIERNVVWTPGDGKMKAWIMYSGKKGVEGGGSKNNVAKNNYANKFDFKIGGVTEEKNEKVTEKIYQEGLARALKTINDKFGKDHVAAGKPRLVTK